MKVCIAYESKYGNGKKCVEHLQNTISEKGHEVEIHSVHDIKPNSIPSADLYVFSAPTQMGKAAGKMRKFLKKLDIKPESAKYALMTTYWDPKTKSLQTMDDLLKSTGMAKVSAGLKIKVGGMKGPLEEGYQQKIEDFATEILKK